MQTRRSWDEQRRLLTGDWRVIAPDLPGFGESLEAEATMPAAAAALIAVWDREGVRRSHLVGYSLGGRLALYVAAHHQERVASLLTLSAHAGLEGGEREARRRADAELAQRIEREGMDWFAGYWAAQPLFAGLARRGPDLVAELDRRRRALDPAGAAASLRGMGAGAMDPFWDRLPALALPATFAAGAEDSRYSAFARRLAATLPRGRVELMEAAGHAAHLERPADFAAVLLRHLSHR